MIAHRVVVMALALGACKGDAKPTESTKIDTPAPKPAQGPSPAKSAAPSGPLSKDEATAKCDALIAAEIHGDLSLQALGERNGAMGSRLTCIYGPRTAIAFVDCDVSRADFQKSAPGFKASDGTSAWKPIAGPGVDARRADGAFGGMPGPMIQFWHEATSCKVAVTAANSIDVGKWADAIAKALTPATKPF